MKIVKIKQKDLERMINEQLGNPIQIGKYVYDTYKKLTSSPEEKKKSQEGPLPFSEKNLGQELKKQGKLTEFGKAPGLRGPRMKMRGRRRKQRRGARRDVDHCDQRCRAPRHRRLPRRRRGCERQAARWRRQGRRRRGDKRFSRER
jgi:hypothetical protein